MNISLCNKQELHKTAQMLKNGKVILYPTDTIWGIGCVYDNILSIKKIFYIKKRDTNKKMILLVESIKRLKKYVFLTKNVIKIIQNYHHPLTVIYKNPKKKFNRFLINKKDNTIAIRLIKDSFCAKIIQKINKPLISTSANISGDINNIPDSFHNISINILKKVDYIVNINRDKMMSKKSSSIIKISKNGNIKFLRN